MRHHARCVRHNTTWSATTRKGYCCYTQAEHTTPHTTPPPPVVGVHEHEPSNALLLALVGVERVRARLQLAAARIAVYGLVRVCWSVHERKRGEARVHDAPIHRSKQTNRQANKQAPPAPVNAAEGEGADKGVGHDLECERREGRVVSGGARHRGLGVVHLRVLRVHDVHVWGLGLDRCGE